MRRMIVTVTALVAAVLAARAGMHAQAGAQSATPRPQPAQPARPTGPPTPVFTLADHFLQWRLLPGEKAYEAIDGDAPAAIRQRPGGHLAPTIATRAIRSSGAASSARRPTRRAPSG